MGSGCTILADPPSKSRRGPSSRAFLLSNAANTGKLLSSMSEYSLTTFPPKTPLENIRLGNIVGAQNLTLLRDMNKVRAIVNVTYEDDAFPTEPLFTYLHVPANDEDKQDMSDIFRESTEFIQSFVDRGLTVFVHCQMGMSRSVAVLCAFLMSQEAPEKRLSFADSFLFLRKHRNIVRMSKGFAKQLIKMESDTFQAARAVILMFVPSPTVVSPGDIADADEAWPWIRDNPQVKVPEMMTYLEKEGGRIQRAMAIVKKSGKIDFIPAPFIK